MAIVAEVSRCCRLGEKPEAGLMGDRIATGSRATQPLPFRPPDRTIPRTSRPSTTEDRVTVADAKAALDRGRPVVLVRPPAVEQAAELWGLITPETPGLGPGVGLRVRSEEHTSELQSLAYLVCRLLLEKKKKY